MLIIVFLKKNNNLNICASIIIPCYSDILKFLYINSLIGSEHKTNVAILSFKNQYNNDV